MKLCAKCKIRKKNSEFNKQAKSKDGIAYWCRSCMNDYDKNYRDTKEGYLKNSLSSSKKRSKNKSLAFNLDIEYLESIALDKCPVFGIDLIYQSSRRGKGFPNKHTASLDRVIPELGYVKGNVVYISHWANIIKSNATEVELYAVADWLHDKRKEVLNAYKEKPAPVPTRIDPESSKHAEPGSLSSTWFGEDDDIIDDTGGAV
jgi:hypothetical protein